METTALIGKIVGPYILVSGIGFLTSGNFYKDLLKDANQSDPMTVNLSGMIHFFIGVTILANHFLFGSLFQIAITFVGFVFFIKGTNLIILPKLTLKSNNTSIKVLRVSASD